MDSLLRFIAHPAFSFALMLICYVLFLVMVFYGEDMWAYVCLYSETVFFITTTLSIVVGEDGVQ